MPNLKKTSAFIIAAFLLSSVVTVFAQNKTIVIDDNYKCSCKVDSVDKLPVFSIAQKMPEFPGGEAAMMKFISNNLVYSLRDTTEQIQTKVLVMFIVDTGGNLRNICVKNPRHADRFTQFEKECMKVFTKMPKWSAGELNGKKVNVKYDCPIHVDLK
jgi:periplasmic protein TonB